MATPPLIITDFDGTVARLVVDWADVRRRAGVARIGELWRSTSDDAWAPVREAEVAAARLAVAVTTVDAWLLGAERFAVITNNSRDCIAAYLERVPALGSRCALVSGREDLGGPKEDRARFAAAFERSLVALGAARAGDVVYLGDQEYELIAASACGATAMLVRPDGEIVAFHGEARVAKEAL